MILYKSQLPEFTIKYKKGEIVKRKIGSSSDAAETFRLMFDADTLDYNESFIVMFLNNSNNTIGWIKLSSGGMTGTLVDIRMLMATALACGAVGIIMAHNHPSGTLKPSQADIQLTKKIKQGGDTLDIKVLDHLIITSESYFSFADENII